MRPSVSRSLSIDAGPEDSGHKTLPFFAAFGFPSSVRARFSPAYALPASLHHSCLHSDDASRTRNWYDCFMIVVGNAEWQLWCPGESVQDGGRIAHSSDAALIVTLEVDD